MFVDEGMTWSDANHLCESKSAYMAELIEPKERESVWYYLRGCILFLLLDIAS